MSTIPGFKIKNTPYGWFTIGRTLRESVRYVFRHWTSKGIDKIEISIPYIMFLINKILFKTYTRNEIDILIDKKIKELENNGHKTKGHAPIFLVAIDIFNKEFLWMI